MVFFSLAILPELLVNTFEANESGNLEVMPEILRR